MRFALQFLLSKPDVMGQTFILLDQFLLVTNKAIPDGTIGITRGDFFKTGFLNALRLTADTYSVDNDSGVLHLDELLICSYCSRFSGGLPVSGIHRAGA
jgi:hypothetical protein